MLRRFLSLNSDSVAVFLGDGAQEFITVPYSRVTYSPGGEEGGATMIETDVVSG